jgi:hypothetical protein
MLAKKGGEKRGGPAQFADWMFKINLKHSKITQQYILLSGTD